MSADVAVVGAGPAGAWAARCLARRGARVLLFDCSHPREKPCGGGVTGRALSLVAAELSDGDLPAVAIRHARFVNTSTGDSVSVALEGGALHPSLVVASRREFDARLVDAAARAGASVHRDRVTAVSATSSGFTVETVHGRYAAPIVVGADGANSLVRRRLAAPLRRDQLSIATGFYAHGATSDEVVIEMVAEPPGYIWSFPRPSHLAVGICAQGDCGPTAARLRSRVARWIATTGIAGDAPLEAYSWPIPSLPAADLERLVLNGRGWCLVGDAAGLVDPITREGIYLALLSGEWAAEAIGGGDGLDAYGDRVRGEIAPDLARAARLKDAFFHPRFASLLLEALRASPRVRAVMADLVSGTQPYAGLRRRLLATAELGLACRLGRLLASRSLGIGR